MEDWMAYISTRSLERGCDYFESGCVRAVEHRADGWRVAVSGSRDYTVFVPDSMDPHEAQCTCPHYADGNICKHIAAAFIAVERRQNTRGDKGSGTESESIEDIVTRTNADDLRAFVIEMARYDETLERELRATFGIADVKQAKRELQKVTTALMRRYERGGFIDWHDAMEFAHEYTVAVESIMRPFYSSKDADALIDLVAPRLVQLQRICIDDSDGFFSGALDDVVEHLGKAFALGGSVQRQRLLEVLNDFLEKNPGKDRGDVYWFEQEVVEEFLADRFSQDAEFAPIMMELADERLDSLPPAPENEFDRYKLERARWAGTHLKAMAALGNAPDDLRAYAEANGLLGSADTIHLIADAYMTIGSPQEAVALLRDNLNAREQYRLTSANARPPRIVDRLVEIAKEACTQAELSELYTALLLLEPNSSIRDDDLARWYDELHRLTDETEWNTMREKLLEELPDTTANTCLAHEGSLEQLYNRIMANGGSDLMRFENVLSNTHPEPYIDSYIKDAVSRMKWANDRSAYRGVAADLAHAANLPGGRSRAQKAALAIRAEYPRKRALADELRSAGFAV